MGNDSTTDSGARRPAAGAADTKDRSWELVHQALADPRWRYRSVEGIAATTGLKHEEVQAALEAHRGETRSIFARSPSFHGVRRVHTLRSRPGTLRDLAVDVLAFASR